MRLVEIGGGARERGGGGGGSGIQETIKRRWFLSCVGLPRQSMSIENCGVKTNF